MKHLLVITLFFGSVSAMASSTVCSSEKLYYSFVHEDFGTRPPSGVTTGKLTIVFDQALLVKHAFIVGNANVVSHQVDLVGPEAALSQEGNPVRGSRVFKQVAVLKKIDLKNPAKSKELAREDVICNQSWLRAP